MLTGKAKTEYQKEYMRRRRSNAGLTSKPVRPEVITVRPSDDVRPEADIVRPEVDELVESILVRSAKPFAGELSKGRQVKGFTNV